MTLRLYFEGAVKARGKKEGAKKTARLTGKLTD
jgi:hypothetical protein